jgi:hypothetical protein
LMIDAGVSRCGPSGMCSNVGQLPWLTLMRC